MSALVGRARQALARARRQARELRPTTMTVHRPVVRDRPPPPRAFARFGAGSWIVPPSTVVGPERIAIGVDVIVMEYSRLCVLGGGPDDRTAPRLVIGDHVRLARFNTVSCEVGVVIEDDVAGSDQVFITDNWRLPLDPLAGIDGVPPPPAAPVLIGRGAYLGFGSTIYPGVRVGAGAFVGEGAVVMEDVPAHSVVYGNPAVVTRRHDAATGTWTGPQWP